MRPSRSAPSIIASAIRSFIEPVGFLYSSFNQSSAPLGGAQRPSRMIGVFPIASRMDGMTGSSQKQRLLRRRHGGPDATVAEDNPVDSGRSQRNPSHDLARTSVDAEDRRIYGRTASRQHALRSHPYRSLPERDPHWRQRQRDPLDDTVRLRIDTPHGRVRLARRTPFRPVRNVAGNDPDTVVVRGDPGRPASNVDTRDNAFRLTVDPD